MCIPLRPIEYVPLTNTASPFGVKPYRSRAFKYNDEAVRLSELAALAQVFESLDKASMSFVM
mgnify:CR=1 FL=1